MNNLEFLKETCRSELKNDPTFDVSDYLFRKRAQWPEHIKILRDLYSLGLPQAIKLGLSSAKWREYIRHYSLTNNQCIKQIKSHMKEHGEDALIMLDQGRILFRGEKK